MSVNYAAILSQTPHRFVAPFVSPLNVPLDDLAEVARTAIGGYTWQGGDPEGLRLIAYGLYAGALSEADAATRLQGSDTDLAADVAVAITGLSAFGDEDLAELARTVLHDRVDGEMEARDVDEGWAVTLLELVTATRSHVLEELLARDDASHVVLRWLLQRWSPNDRLVRYADVVMRSNDGAWIAAAALLSVAARAHIDRNDEAPAVPASTSAESHLVVSGILMTEVYDFGRRSTLEVEARARWEQFVVALRKDVAQALSSASAARKLRDIADQDDTTLVALILGVAPTAAARTFAEAGEALLRQYFRPLHASDRPVETEALPYLGPLVINDLAQIWITIGADDGFFDALRENLRCDEYAYTYTFGHYLTDRPRAVVLAAIGAVAGNATQNERLLQAARVLAQELHELPAKGWPTLDSASIESIRERTGIQLPPK